MAFKSFDQWLRETKPLKPKKKVRVLTQEGEDLAREYNNHPQGCSCHLGGAPCSYCTHPGNPYELEATPELWEEMEVDDDRD